MGILDFQKKFKGIPSMKADKAGRINGKAKPKKAKVCVHGRMVDYHYDDQGQPTGNVVCLECRAIIPDPANVLR